MEKFTDKFDSYVCNGDRIEIEINGITYRATILYDSFSHIDDDDCHNTDQSVTGCNDEQFERLLAARKAWINDEWWYCGVSIDAIKNGIQIEIPVSLWGIEANYPGTNNEYLTEVANELLPEAIVEVNKEVKRMIDVLTS